MEERQDRLEQGLEEIRAEAASPEAVAAAKARVWERLAATEPAICMEFRASFSGYRAGTLPEARRLLVEDHLSRCVACRHMLAEEAAGPAVVEMPPVRRGLANWSRWAIAASLLIAGLYLGRDVLDAAFAPGGPRATVASGTGELRRVNGERLAVGDAIGEQEAIRTGQGAYAVLRLADGSQVELNERTELAVHAAWSGQAIELARGDVIVQAAKQRRGHLRVVTRDSVVSVKGTVFAVSAGAAGSLVSVVEGSVQVAQAGRETVLAPGQQSASSSVLAKVPVRQAVSWSPDAGKYYALLSEFAAIEKELAATVAPSVRTRSSLVAQMPGGALIYGSIPNLGNAVSQAISLIEQRAQDSAALAEWWSAEQQHGLAVILRNVQTLMPSLGDEIVFVLVRNPAAPEKAIPVVLAEVRPGAESSIPGVLAQITPPGGRSLPYQMVGPLLVLTNESANLPVVVGLLGQDSGSAFAQEIAQHYQQGVGILLAFDVEAMAAARKSAPAALASAKPKRLFFEQRLWQGIEENEAEVVFNGQRAGLASVLAAPAPSGSAEYATSDAVMVVSAITRNPREAFDELVRITGQTDSRFAQRLAAFEAKTGLRVGDDLASALGTDFTVSLERIAVPAPGWVAAVEVVQPGVLDATMERLVGAVNQNRTADSGQPALAFSQESAGGRTWSTLTMGQRSFTWTYDRGYLIASPERALAVRAIETQASGFPLVRSAAFRDRLPSSSGVHQSGFFWWNSQNVGESLPAGFGGDLLKPLLASQDPVLAVLRGENERITAASRTRLTSLVLSLAIAAGPKARQDATQGEQPAPNAVRN